MMNSANARSFVLLLITGIYCACSYAQTVNQASKTYFDDVAQLKQLNGNILLADHGRIVYAGSCGYADYPAKKVNSLDQRYNLASISKVFTATAILQLKEKGKLSLDDPLINWMPEFPYAAVKIKHLLTHTSGIADFELFESLVKQYPDTVITNYNIIPELKKQQRDLYFTPGDKYSYCNAGYSLLALLVEEVSGLTFPDYLKKYIFKPAGMQDTYVYDRRNSNGYERPVIMHIMQHPYYDPIYVPVDSIRQYRYLNYNCSGLTGQSNIITTIKDLLRFDSVYFAGKLLKAATMEEAFTPVTLNNGTVYLSKYMDTMHGEGSMSYGLGWEIFEQPGYGKSVGHGGFKFGLATFYCRNLQGRQTVIAFDNAPGSEFGRIVTSSLAILNGRPPLVLRTRKSLVGLYGTALVKYGIDHAMTQFNTYKADTGHYYLSEWEMNELGYDLFYKSTAPDHKTLALEVFKIATLVFPDSFNTYDSYGQLLKDSGKKQEAILMYRKSIALNPDNEDGKRILKQLLDSK